MNNICISSLVVRTRPSNLSAVNQRISALSYAEVYGQHVDGRLVVIIDTQDNKQLANTISDIQDLPDILSVKTIYQYEDKYGIPVESAA